MIRLLVIEDQAMLRESLTYTINMQDDLTVVAQAANAGDALGLVEQCSPDAVLMDVVTEDDASGIVAARRIKEAYPEVKVIIMTGVPEVTFVEQARKANVDSFVYKNVGTLELLSVIRSTMEGYSMYPQQSSSVFLGAAALTETEMDILRLTCKAKTRKEIAAELYMSEGTVKRRISEILEKTGYDSILRLAVHAVASGNIAPQIDDDE